MRRPDGQGTGGDGPKAGVVRRRWFQLLVTALVAFVLGLATTAADPTMDGAQEEASEVSAVDSAALDAAQDETTSLQTELRRAEAETERRVREAVDGAATQQRAAVERATATVRARAATRQREAVAAAVTAAVADAEARLAPQAPPAEEPPAATDPRFSYCYEANDAGHGNYQSGVDPEYDWYDDNDGDGVVCEF